MYEVVCDRLVIRTAPDPQAPMQGTRRRGLKLELFDWDPSRTWRRISTSLGPAWVQLDTEAGPNLRPKDVPFSQQPQHPLCQAAREGCLPDIQRFLSEGLSVNARDVDGQTPLMLAAQGYGWEGFVACVLLLEADADPNQTLSRPEEAGQREKLVRLEREKRAAAEREDFAEAGRLKQELDVLKRSLEDTGTTALSLAGDSAAADLLQMISTGTLCSDMQKLHAVYDDIQALPEPACKGIPGRVEALVRGAERKIQLNQKQPSPAAPPTARPALAPHSEASTEDSPSRATAATGQVKPQTPIEEPPAPAEVETNSEDDLPLLDTQVPEDSQGVVYRVVQDKAMVYEEASVSAEVLGVLVKNQLVEVFDYDRSRSFGRIEVCHRTTKFRERGWVLFMDEVQGDLLKAFRR